MDICLELGGKDGFYVRDDCSDLKKAAESLVDGACYNAGQSCCSVERIYVHEKVYDRFVVECGEVMKSYKMGDPLDKLTNMGPMTLKHSPQFL